MTEKVSIEGGEEVLVLARHVGTALAGDIGELKVERRQMMYQTHPPVGLNG